MSSNRVPWSTLRNSWSHTGMSSVLFSLFSSSSGGGGSSLWWVHHWITCRGESHSNKEPQVGLDTGRDTNSSSIHQGQMSVAQRLRAHLVNESMVQYSYPRYRYHYPFRCERYPTLASTHPIHQSNMHSSHRCPVRLLHQTAQTNTQSKSPKVLTLPRTKCARVKAFGN